MNYQIQTLNAISPAIYTQLGEHYHVSDSVGQPDAILVRSASMHDMPLAPSVLSIARAGAGTNNIPIDACTQAGVCVFNTPARMPTPSAKWCWRPCCSPAAISSAASSGRAA